MCERARCVLGLRRALYIFWLKPVRLSLARWERVVVTIRALNIQRVGLLGRRSSSSTSSTYTQPHTHHIQRELIVECAEERLRVRLRRCRVRRRRGRTVLAVASALALRTAYCCERPDKGKGCAVGTCDRCELHSAEIPLDKRRDRLDKQ